MAINSKGVKIPIIYGNKFQEGKIPIMAMHSKRGGNTKYGNKFQKRGK